MHKRLFAALVAAALAVIPVTAALADDDGLSDVYVVHAVDGVEVDVWIEGYDGGPLLMGFKPGDTAMERVPPGEYTIGVYAAGTQGAEPPVITWSGTVPPNASVTLVAHRLPNPEIAPELAVFVNDVSPIADGDARVTVRHTAAAPEVEVSPLGATFSIGQELGPVDVEAGVLPVGVGLPGDDPFFTADLDLAAGTAYFVHAYATDSQDVVGTFSPIIFAIDLEVEDAEEAPQPTGVHSGTGGLLNAGLPMWVSALLLLGALGVAAPAVATATRRR